MQVRARLLYLFAVVIVVIDKNDCVEIDWRYRTRTQTRKHTGTTDGSRN